jgi:hypothetical protein
VERLSLSWSGGAADDFCSSTDTMVGAVILSEEDVEGIM